MEYNLPSGQHLDQMLFRRTSFLALPQTREDAILSEQRFPSSSLYFEHFHLLDFSFRWDDVVIEILLEHDYAGAVLQHVSRVVAHCVFGGGFFACW